MGVNTGTVSSFSTAIFSRVPLSAASMVTTLLSVCTSKKGSPLRTVSPTFLCHPIRLPSSCVKPSLGMIITLAMDLPPYSSFFTASRIIFSLGTTSFSSTGLNGSGTSGAQQRIMGASRS